MYRLVVLSLLVTVVTARPGYLHTVPAAISHQSRVDIIESNPIITTYIEPALHTIVDNHHDIDFHDEHNFHDDSHLIFDDHDVAHLLKSVDVHNIHESEPLETISHQEIHQTHETPIVEISEHHELSAPLEHSLEGIELHEELPLEHEELLSIVSLPEEHSGLSVEDHEAAAVHIEPVVLEHSSEIQSSVSSHDLHQIHDVPAVHIIEPIVHHEPIVESVDVHGAIPLVHTAPIAVSHSARHDVHTSTTLVETPVVHHHGVIATLPEVHGIHAW